MCWEFTAINAKQRQWPGNNTAFSSWKRIKIAATRETINHEMFLFQFQILFLYVVASSNLFFTELQMLRVLDFPLQSRGLSPACTAYNVTIYRTKRLKIFRQANYVLHFHMHVLSVSFVAITPAVILPFECPLLQRRQREKRFSTISFTKIRRTMLKHVWRFERHNSTAIITKRYQGGNNGP